MRGAQLLLIFDREDAQCDAWSWAAQKLDARDRLGGTRHALVRNFQPETILAKMAELEPNLIVIDRRASNRIHDVDSLVR